LSDAALRTAANVMGRSFAVGEKVEAANE
jgi:hypothetical protein